jgi:hypothetical protein
MSFGDNSGQAMPGMDPALQQFILNETEKQKLQVILNYSQFMLKITNLKI